MTLNLSIKNVPEPVVVRLRERAKHNHRSLQGELLAILEGAAGPSLAGIHEHAKALGVSTGDEAVWIIRAERDAR
jgi:plasmid stability protein